MRRHGPPRRRRYARQSARVEGWHGGEGPPGQGHLTFRHSGGLALSAGAAYSQAPRAPAARRGGSRLYLTLERPHPGGKPTLPPPKTSEAPPQHRAWTILNMTARRSQRSREISHGRYAIILAANIYVLRNINETLCGCHNSESRVLPVSIRRGCGWSFAIWLSGLHAFIAPGLGQVSGAARRRGPPPRRRHARANARTEGWHGGGGPR